MEKQTADQNGWKRIQMNQLDPSKSVLIRG
jgi:hypothetical protein